MQRRADWPLLQEAMYRLAEYGRPVSVGALAGSLQIEYGVARDVATELEDLGYARVARGRVELTPKGGAEVGA